MTLRHAKAFLKLNHHVESVNYQVSALSDYTQCPHLASALSGETKTNNCWSGKTICSHLLPSIAACALHEENLNERADITCPCPCVHKTQSVQTLWTYGSGLLVENSSPDPVPNSHSIDVEQDEPWNTGLTVDIGIKLSTCTHSQHGQSIMMNMLFTLFDLGAFVSGNEHFTQESDLMRWVATDDWTWLSYLLTRLEAWLSCHVWSCDSRPHRAWMSLLTWCDHLGSVAPQ